MNTGTAERFKKLCKPAEYDEKKYFALLRKVNFNRAEYCYAPPLSPNIAFFKFLATQKSRWRLALNVPDTIVFNDTERPL